MKTCPQCGRGYDEDTNFCLNDGEPLISDSAATVPSFEIPTVIQQPAAVIPIQQPQPPQPQFQAQFQPPPIRETRSSSRLIVALLGLVLLVIIGAGIGLGYYFLRADTDDNIGKANANVTPAAGKKDEIADEKERLKTEQEKLAEEKRKLEQDKKALEEKKKLTPTPTVDSAQSAYIIDPPTNIRATPNGRIICVIRARNAPVRILGSTGVTDNNGTWYYTDACSQRGVIHSSQFRF